jgi:hypothetical protein
MYTFYPYQLVTRVGMDGEQRRHNTETDTAEKLFMLVLILRALRAMTRLVRQNFTNYPSHQSLDTN